MAEKRAGRKAFYIQDVYALPEDQVKRLQKVSNLLIPCSMLNNMALLIALDRVEASAKARFAVRVDPWSYSLNCMEEAIQVAREILTRQGNEIPPRF